MKRTFMTLTDKDGKPITDKEQATKLIYNFVSECYPKKQLKNVHVTKIDENGNYSATI